MKTALLLSALLAAAPSRLRAAAVDARSAARVSDSAFGVDLAGFEAGAAGSTATAALVDAYSAAGVKWARVRASWAAVETSTGVDATADLDALVPALFDRGVKVLLTLDAGGQKLYAAGALPTEENGALAPYRAWVGRMAQRYQGAVSAWQVEDRPQDEWASAGGTVAYAALLRAADAALRARSPSAFVVLGGARAGDLDFLRGELAGGDGRVAAAYVLPAAGLDASARGSEFAAVQTALAEAPLPRPALWLGAETAPAAAGAEAEPPSPVVAAKLLAREEVLALAAGASRRFFAPALAASGAPLEEPLTVLRALAALFDDGVAVASTLRATFMGAPRGLVSAAFATRTGAPLVAFWADGVPAENDSGRQASLTLSQPLRDPVLVDPLDAETTPLGSGSLTAVSVPVRDYPQFVTSASVLKDAAAILLVPEETYASPSVVHGGAKVAIRFDATAAGPATIEIFTARRELLRRETVDAAAGPGSWDWTADVGAGTYFWRVTFRGQSLVGKFEVLR